MNCIVVVIIVDVVFVVVQWLSRISVDPSTKCACHVHVHVHVHAIHVIISPLRLPQRET